MQSLLTDMIICAVDDVESTRYRVLAELQKKSDAFDAKMLYPHILELINTRQNLLTLHKNRDDIIKGLKQKADITLFDYMDNIIKREDVTDKFRENIHNVLDLAEWAFPRIEDTLGVGKEILIETAESIEIEWVNIIPTYPDEGYLIVSAADEESGDNPRVFSYERIKYIVDPEDPIYVLRTKQKSVDSAATQPEQLKQYLLSTRTDEERNANPNPATVFVDVSVPYSFTKTAFPVAKRSVLRWFRLQEHLNS